MEDRAGNSLTEQITVLIEPVNDHAPMLFLDGDNGLRDYQTVFYEGQEYLGGAIPTRLSANLTITDDDVSTQTLETANISIIDSE